MDEATSIHLATPGDSRVVASLLDRFNREFGVSTPGVDVLAARLAQYLSGASMFALCAGDPAVGVALVSLRPNAWHAGPVGLLDELYVIPDCRNRGAGTRLLRGAEEQVRERGGQLLEINVDGGDHDALRFYRRHGYVDRDPGESVPARYLFREI